MNLGLLSALEGGIALNVGDVSVTGTSTNATPAVATSPAAPAAPVAAAAPAPAAVPDVTTVHTGEYWAGTLPVILLAGMGLAGLLLIGRRRIASLARISQFHPSAAEAAHDLSHSCRPVRGRPADRHRARPSGPPPFPLRSRGPARRRPHHDSIGALTQDAHGAAQDAPDTQDGRTTGRQERSRRIRRERQMQREPVLRAARDGVAESRPERGQPGSSAAPWRGRRVWADEGAREPAPGRPHARRGDAPLRRRFRRQLRLRPPGAPASRPGRADPERAGRHGQDRHAAPRRLLPGGGRPARASSRASSAFRPST